MMCVSACVRVSLWATCGYCLVSYGDIYDSDAYSAEGTAWAYIRGNARILEHHKFMWRDEMDNNNALLYNIIISIVHENLHSGLG